jgi:hypothetical protein
MKSVTLRNIIALIALIAVAALVFIASRGDTTKFEPGSPEATVQSFLQAMVDRDNDGALSFFEPGTQCDSSDLDRQYISPDLTVDLIETSINGDRAQVKIRTRYSSGDLFGGWSEDHSISLKKIDGEWLISGTPWPLYECDDVKP